MIQMKNVLFPLLRGTEGTFLASLISVIVLMSASIAEEYSCVSRIASTRGSSRQKMQSTFCLHAVVAKTRSGKACIACACL